VLAQVAERGRAEDGVGNGMCHDVSIGGRLDAAIANNDDPGEHQGPRPAKGVGINAEADPHDR
jgi:hypothetical protein